jgi:hypothetical protein
MRFILAIVFSVIVGSLVLGGTFPKPQRFWNGSHLGVFETRIASVGDEVMRRTAWLSENFAQFKNCGPDCADNKVIFAQRDFLVEKSWPSVFDRLMVDQDWGELPASEGAHEWLKQEMQEHGGPDRLRNFCWPRMEYRWPMYNGEKTAEYRLDRFECKRTSSSGLPDRRRPFYIR